MTYPELPNNRLIVNGVDLSVRFQMVLLDGYELNPPAPKLYTVDIPGGNGSIDLTEALTGDTAYENREQTFNFVCMFPENFEKVKTDVSNYLHGKAFDYQMTMDPDYTYHGRFTVESYSHAMYSEGKVGTIQVKISANPYKKKQKKSYILNGIGGRMFNLISGRRPVRPVIETKRVTEVSFNGVTTIVPVGTYRLNKVLFKEGVNEIYVNTMHLYTTSWNDLLADGSSPLTWSESSKVRWDELEHLNSNPNRIPYSWNNVATQTWGDYSTKKWSDMNFTPENVDDYKPYSAYLTYEWEDL